MFVEGESFIGRDKKARGIYVGVDYSYGLPQIVTIGGPVLAHMQVALRQIPDEEMSDEERRWYQKNLATIMRSYP